MYPSWVLILSVSILSVELIEADQICNQELLDRSFVTQCGPGLCEPLLESNKEGEPAVVEWPKTNNEVVQITSSRKGERFNVTIHQALNTQEHFYEESHVMAILFVDPETKYQRILGFGTTLTDASVKNVDELISDVRNDLINSYFSSNDGIGLNLIKVPIGSTKYSYTNYVLEQPDEFEVELSPYDTDLRIPIIEDAIKAAGKLKNRIKIIASSTTAPGDMKTNKQAIYGGYLRPEKVSNYAKYISSFAAAYKNRGLNIWSIIVSELPIAVARDNNDTLDYNSMAMRPSDVIRLVKALDEEKSKHKSLENFRMLILGDSRAHLTSWADAVLKTNDVNSLTSGFAYTCDSEKSEPYDNIVYTIRKYPNKYLLTLGSVHYGPTKLGNWQHAEDYGIEMIKNLEYGSVGWIDNNLALDLSGGPVISNKFKANAAIMIDPKRGYYYRNPMFYSIGHLSRYVKPGSIRVKATLYSSPHMFACHHIAFLTPDNYLVLYVMNNNIGPMPLRLGINTTTRLEILLETKSFNTFIFRL